MYINLNIQELSVKLFGATLDDPIMSLAAVKAHILMKLLPDERQTTASMALHDLVCNDVRVGSADHTFRRMIGRANVHKTTPSNKSSDNESEVFLLNYTKYSEDDSRDIEVKIGSSQVVILPEVISDMLKFIQVAPFRYRSVVPSTPTSVLPENQNDNTLQVVVSTDSPNKVEACFSPVVSVPLKKTNYRIESSNMRLLLVDMGSIDSPGPFASSMKSSAITETLVLQGKMQARFEMTTELSSGTTVEKDYKIDAERVEIYTAQGLDLLHPVQILEPAKFAIFYYQKVCSRTATHMTDVKFVTLSPIDLTVSMQNAALASTLASSISETFAADEERAVTDNEIHTLSASDANRIARLDSYLMKDSDDTTQDPNEQYNNVSIHSGEPRSMRRTIRLKLTSPEATLTVTNDFQGLVSFYLCFKRASIFFSNANRCLPFD